MTFSIGGLIEGFTGSKKVNETLLSPIWMAIIITLILMIILYFILRNHIEENLFSTLAQISIYAILTLMGAIFLHDQALRQQFGREHEDKRNRDIVEGGIPELGNPSSMVRPRIESDLENYSIDSGITQIIEEKPEEPYIPSPSSDGTVGDEYFD